MKRSQVFVIEQNGDSHATGTINLAFEAHNENFETQPTISPKTEKVIERARWGNSVEFLMVCISMSVGLGNLWRFPFIACQNGGGAFLIPYFIVLVLIGRPVYYLDMFLGQFTSKANVKMFTNLAPINQGIAFGQIFASVNAAFYYCSIMALSIYYLVQSLPFAAELPWAKCRSEWENCVDVISSNVTSNGSVSSAELYLKKVVLREKDNIDDGIGAPMWHLTLCLFVSWLFVFLVTVKGIRSTGKASYFLALFPYVLMIILLIRGATLEGAQEGIMYFLTPRWSEMLTAKVWREAVTQCFFSLNLASGAIVMYSSYNDFHHNIKRDSIIISLTDTLSSFLAGCTIFAVLGNLAHILKKDIKDVVKFGGPGIAFVSYPSAIANISILPQLFSAFFFLMLFVLGIGSLMSMQGCIATILQDQYPHLKDWWVAAGTCVVGFLVGLVYVTPGGQFVLALVDYFAVTFILYIMAIVEVVAVVWIYGLENVCLDLKYMSKSKVGVYWRMCWGVVTPVLLLVILTYSLVKMERIKYGEVDYPDAAIGVGWFLFIFGILQIPIWAIITLWRKRDLGLSKSLSYALSNHKWGPDDPHRRQEWREYKDLIKRESTKKSTTKPVRLFRTLIGRD